MCRKMIYFVSFVLVLGLATDMASADPYRQDIGPDGIVCIEAENFDDNILKGASYWEFVTSTDAFTPPDGFSGGGAMQSMPDTPLGGGPGFDTGYVENAPRLDYEINFDKTGTYYVWILAYGMDGNSDSCHAGMDGEETPLSNRMSGWSGSYSWDNDRYERPERSQIEITTTGVHTLNIYQREDGLVVDKIVLTTNPDYTPTGEGPEESSRDPLLKAYNPTPAEGALYEDIWVSLGWSPGDFAVSHDVYLGDNFDDVNTGAESTFQGNQASTMFIVGFPGMPYPEGLVPGTTYYWRIDEVNDTNPNSPWKGDVWSFKIPPRTAYAPTPADGAKFVVPDVELSWTTGFGAKLHYIYFGDNFDDVNSATVGIPSALNTFTPPGTLELEKTYYWRIDEFDGIATNKGDVWSFKTLPDIPITDPNLVGWWKFEAGSGSVAVDFSGHGNNGTIVDNVQWVPGMFNLALEFLGDDQGHVELPPGLVTTASGSILMWVNTDLTDNEGMFWYGTETGGDGFGDENEIHIHIDDPGVLGFGLEGATDVRLDGPQLAGAGWTHVAATWDLADGCRLYANGVEVDFQAHNSTVADLAVIRLGRPVSTGNGNRYHDGLMDDVRLFDHTISAAQVVEAMRGDPLLAWGPNPTNGSTPYIRDATPLSWSPGDNASGHDVYFGTDRDAVIDADESDTTGIYRGRQGVTIYTPPDVEWGGGPYYWRVDEYNTDATISKGNVWSFTVINFIEIDGIEDYNDYPPDEIFSTWIDGWEIPTNGSLAGHAEPPFAETGNVHGGNQSMPVYYENNFKHSEITMTLVYPRNWTEEGVGVLSLWFYGDAANAAERMYVNLNGIAVVYHDNPDAALIEEWTEWTIDLQEFAAQGVNLANVTTISIGFGDKNNLLAGGSGMVLFDDIRLYRPEPEPEPQP